MAKKAAKKAKKRTKKAAAKPTLIVGSKVKEYVKSQGCKNSFEVLEAANAALQTALDNACARATANKRSTVRAQDF